MNSNAVHNILNIAQVILGSLLTFDWTSIGTSTGTAGKIAGGLVLASSVVKLGINVFRDGLGGLTAPQPPVQK
jgi:hypothetical protein